MLGLAAEKTDRLSELNTKLEALRAHGATLERQKAQLNDTLEAIAGRRPGLTKELAKGDETAGKRLDDLDSEKRSVRRRLEGVDGHLASNLAEIQPLEAEHARESAIAAAEERRKQFEALSQRARARLKRLNALYFELAGELTAQYADLVSMRDGYREFLGGNEASKIYDEMGFQNKAVNSGWRLLDPTALFGPDQHVWIRPMLPPKR